MGSSNSTRKITLVNDDKAGVIKLSESLAHRLRGQIEGQQQQAAAAGVGITTPAEAESPTHPPPAPPPPVSHPPVADIPQAPEPPKVPHVVPEPFVPESLVAAAGGVDATPELISAAVPEVAGVAGVTAAAAAPDTTTPAAANGESQQQDGGVAGRSEGGGSVSESGGSLPPWSLYADDAHLMLMRLKEEKEQELQQINREWREKIDAREQEFTKMSRLSEEEVSNAIQEVEKLFVKASCTPVCQDHQDAVLGCYQDHPHQALRCSRQVEDFARCVDLSRLQSVLRQRAN